jgi:hypothetical protein
MPQRTLRNVKKNNWRSLGAWLSSVALACACGLSPVTLVASAQTPDARRAGEGTTAAVMRAAEAGREIDELVRRAMGVACTERELDPQGSAPIDEMQARPSLPLRHAEVVAGTQRAERLLPVAKILAAESLRRLLREYRIKESPAVRAAFTRLAQVKLIKPDMELRDNASVLYKEPRTIRFGTIFLAGLRSDEGMLGVLAHELTHVADGAGGSLHALFRGVAQRAGSAAGLRITTRRGEELTCDLVGALAVRAYIARTPGVETLARRTARALAHNCVERDHTDRAHLSPRTTMRALLALDPALARELTGDPIEPGASPDSSTPTPRRTQRRAAHPIAPRTPRR